MAQIDLGQVVGPKGADGAPGKDGVNGKDGAPGATGATGKTPNIQIGTVTTLNPGSPATASITGTVDEPLLNLGIPKGDTGAAPTNAVTTNTAQTITAAKTFSAAVTVTGVFTANNANNGVVYGAVWNADLAEWRPSDDAIPAGYIVASTGDQMSVCRTKKNKAKLFVVSDTYAMRIGEKLTEDEVGVWVAIAGRAAVLYDFEKDIMIGDYIGCNNCGTARKMSKLEAWLHPERILGRVSSIPVDGCGRIWVDI